MSFLVECIRKSSHELLGMPRLWIPQTDPWAPPVLSQTHLPPLVSGSLPAFLWMGRKCEPLQTACKQVQRTCPAMQGGEKAHKPKHFRAVPHLGKTDRTLSALGLFSRAQERHRILRILSAVSLMLSGPHSPFFPSCSSD